VTVDPTTGKVGQGTVRPRLGNLVVGMKRMLGVHNQVSVLTFPDEFAFLRSVEGE
jgi:hypothetical protein